MKYRYLKITGELVWGTNNLRREDLAGVKQRRYDAIVDLEQMKIFNAETNTWDEIKGD